MGKTVGTGVNIELMVVGVMKTIIIKMATKNLNMSKRGTYVNTYLTFGVQGLCQAKMGSNKEACMLHVPLFRGARIVLSSR